MTKRSISHDNGEPESRLLRRILRDPALSAAQVAADNRLIQSLVASEIDIAELKKALDAGANPDRTVWNRQSALHMAVLRRSAEAVALLLKYDVSVEDINGQGATALDEAHRISFKEGVKLLTEVNARTNLYDPRGSSAGYTSYQDRINLELIQTAADRKRHPREIRTALDLGAEIDPGGDSPSPLFLAIANCSEEKVDILLEAGATLQPVDQSEGTALAQLWHARPHDILSPEWRRLYKKIHERGGGDMFSTACDDFTLKDLRQTLGLPLAFGQMTVMHHLVSAGQIDFVLAAILRDPAQKLMPEDLMKSVRIGDENICLIAEIAKKGRLDDFLSVAVWQDRGDALVRLQSMLNPEFILQNKIDFEKHIANARAHRQKMLQQHAKKFAPRL